MKSNENISQEDSGSNALYFKPDPLNARFRKIAEDERKDQKELLNELISGLVRFSPKTEKWLAWIAHEENKTRSQIIIEAVEFWKAQKSTPKPDEPNPNSSLAYRAAVDAGAALEVVLPHDASESGQQSGAGVRPSRKGPQPAPFSKETKARRTAREGKGQK